MNTSINSTFLALLFAFPLVATFAAPDTKSAREPDPLKFQTKEYYHRWSKDDQHEYTPRGQEDLEHWADMITVNYYRQATSGEALAATANSVLENYKTHKAIVLKTDSVPRTPEKPAEYLIAVVFPRPDYIEAVFARFKIVDGTGTAAIYSHREYGAKIGDQMNLWLQNNGPLIEKALMNWEDIPSLVTAKK